MADSHMLHITFYEIHTKSCDLHPASLASAKTWVLLLRRWMRMMPIEAIPNVALSRIEKLQSAAYRLLEGFNRSVASSKRQCGNADHGKESVFVYLSCNLPDNEMS